VLSFRFISVNCPITAEPNIWIVAHYQEKSSLYIVTRAVGVNI
jgi:hypothetical protein